MTDVGMIEYMRRRQAATDARRAGLPRPWSDDPIIRDFFLCSVVRDDDRTSVDARVYIQAAPEEDQLALARAFRFFNHVPTLIEVHRFGGLRSSKDILEILKRREARGEKVLGAQAFKINVKGGVWNLAGIAAIASQLAGNRLMPTWLTARETVAGLMERGVGQFLAYQVMQDLRWVSGPYADEDLWAWVGPGAARGLLRHAGMYGGPRSWEERRFDSNTIAMKTVFMPKEMREAMLPLLAEAQAVLGPHINMFEIEHNLCEWDKYMRIATGESKGKKFTPRSET